MADLSRLNDLLPAAAVRPPAGAPLSPTSPPQPQQLLSWSDALWKEVNEQVLNEESVGTQLAQRLECAPTSLDTLLDTRLSSVEELAAHLLALGFIKHLERVRSILSAQQEEECWRCASRMREVWMRCGKDEDGAPFAVPIGRAVLSGVLRKQVTRLSFSPSFTTTCVRECTRTEMEQVLSLADCVKQSRWDKLDQYRNDLVRLTDERVQQVGISYFSFLSERRLLGLVHVNMPRFCSPTV
jgi:hypothetical protein